MEKKKRGEGEGSIKKVQKAKRKKDPKTASLAASSS